MTQTAKPAVLADPSAALESLAKGQAKVWIDSPYYDDAERWMHLFWSEESIFQKWFITLDRTSMVELACGRGRHSEHVLTHYDKGLGQLIGLDILASNVDYCCRRLVNYKKVSFVENDGISFRPVWTGSASAVFCYDAMVHFDHEVVKAYLEDAKRILAIGGRALLHHSNYDENPASLFSKNPHARAFMSAELFRSLAEKIGLKVLDQKSIRWGKKENLDCVSLIEKV